jgi:hypothetical protein
LGTLSTQNHILEAIHSAASSNTQALSGPLKLPQKTSDFEPHGNFEPFLASSVASLDEICTKNEQNKIAHRNFFYNF